MRTTIDVDEDVLAAAKELARKRKVSVGRIVSGLLREAMSGLRSGAAASEDEAAGVGGFRPFSARGRLVSEDFIEKLRDGEGV